MQMLLKQDVTDPAAWRASFDANREAQGAAGLSLLQLWVDADDTRTQWALFECNDKADAKRWLSEVDSGLHIEAVTATQAHFVKTA